MSTGPMPVFPSGTVLIPYTEKSASTGIIASLEYVVLGLYGIVIVSW